jgi:hypothetical protein
MTTRTITIHNVETGEIETRDMNAEELAQLAAEKRQWVLAGHCDGFPQCHRYGLPIVHTNYKCHSYDQSHLGGVDFSQSNRLSRRSGLRAWLAFVPPIYVPASGKESINCAQNEALRSSPKPQMSGWCQPSGQAE